MFHRRIYLDYASITPIDRLVVREMEKYSTEGYANPSSVYREGVFAKKALEQARGGVANYIGAHPDEIFFTSGGTEANNIAILGVVEYLHKQGIKYSDIHILASAIEHSSVLECVRYIATLGVQIDFVNIESNGVISLEDFKKKLRPNTALVSVMTVNNELGTIQPIKEIAKIIRNYKQNVSSRIGIKYPLFHTDAAQALLFDLNVEKSGVDMLILDGSKIYGPRGVGCLYAKRHTPICPILHGGGQENGLRSGTENIPAIMGFAKALDIAKEERENEFKRLTILREYFISKLQNLRADIMIYGHDAPVSPHILNISIPNINNEFFVLQMDVRGVAISTKSSCLRDEDESYVLRSIGADSKTSLRFSFGRYTKKRDIDRVICLFGTILLGSKSCL